MKKTFYRRYQNAAAYFVFPPTDLFEPIEDKEMAEAEVGSLFFFFTFLLEPSRLRDPEAVAVFFSLGGVSEPGAQIYWFFEKNMVYHFVNFSLVDFWFDKTAECNQKSSTT